MGHLSVSKCPDFCCYCFILPWALGILVKISCRKSISNQRRGVGDEKRWGQRKEKKMNLTFKPRCIFCPFDPLNIHSSPSESCVMNCSDSVSLSTGASISFVSTSKSYRIKDFPKNRIILDVESTVVLRSRVPMSTP